jgi:hypothetical protein
MQGDGDQERGPASSTESQQCPSDVLQRNYEIDEHSECFLKSSDLAHSSESVDTDEENPLKLRNSARTGGACSKAQKICCYQFCPSPMHSKKWRTVTHGTSAGGRDWDSLVGQLLCDSCYSTYRKHGTFMRSVRTNEGWLRMKSADMSADFSSPQTLSIVSQKHQRVHDLQHTLAIKRQDCKQHKRHQVDLRFLCGASVAACL